MALNLFDKRSVSRQNSRLAGGEFKATGNGRDRTVGDDWSAGNAGLEADSHRTIIHGSFEDILRMAQGVIPFSFICATEEKCYQLQNRLYHHFGGDGLTICRNTNSVFDNLTVFENVYVRKNYFMPQRNMMQRLELLEMEERFGIDIDPDRSGHTLIAEEKYLVELLRIVSQKPRVVILSSISMVMGFTFFESFCKILTYLKEHDARVLIVSTRWEDTVQICEGICVQSANREDRFSLLRVQDIRRNPKLLFYALADNAEERVPIDANLVLNGIMDMAAPFSGDLVLEDRVRNTIETLRNVMHAVCCVLCLRNSRNHLATYYMPEAGIAKYRIQSDFLSLFIGRTDKVAYYSKKKYDFAQVFAEKTDNVELLINYPVVAVPEKLGLLILMFENDFICSSEDITAIRVCSNMISNMITSSDLLTRNMLIEESNHRVKNNLQMIVSLLYIQRRVFRDSNRDGFLPFEQVDTFIDEMSSRIRMMANMHDFVSKSYKDDDKVSSDRIVSAVVDLYREENFRYELDVESFLIRFEKASSIAMVLNEIVCNSIKYAFEGETGRENVIRIAFRMEGEGMRLEVQDNGRGLPKEYDIQNSNSLGMKVVQSLATRLHGKITMSNQGGAHFILTVPND